MSNSPLKYLKIPGSDLFFLAPQSQMVQKELLDKVQVQLTAAEEALATKQGKIDHMKQEIFQKEKELETISVFQAQVGENIRGHFFLISDLSI